MRDAPLDSFLARHNLVRWMGPTPCGRGDFFRDNTGAYLAWPKPGGSDYFYLGSPGAPLASAPSVGPMWARHEFFSLVRCAHRRMERRPYESGNAR